MKKVLITGSTDGIGRATAHELASLGYDTLIHGRSQERVNRTVAEIKRSFPETHCEGITADFSSLHAVRTMAEEIRDRQLYPDILINNAGIVMAHYTLSADGYEMTFAVNHLAHFYLTLLLLDHLPEPARIINVASMAHASYIDFDSLNNEAGYDGIEAYSASKLCNILFTYKLARLLEDKREITVNCMHPGVINTKVLRLFWGPIGAPASEGARNEVYLAVSRDIEYVSGAYFRDRRPQRSAEISYDKNIQDECWERSLEMLYSAGFDPGPVSVLQE